MTPRRTCPQAGPALVAPNTQCATFWIDESGSRGSGGQCFVVAGIKTRRPDAIQREIHELRQKHSYDGEFKYSRISDGSLRRFYELIDILEQSDAKLTATVVDARVFDPFRGTEKWHAQAQVVSRLVIGNLNRNEIASVMVDAITTPRGESFGCIVKRQVNGHFRATSVTAAFSLDSRSNDLLQAADLVAGAISHARRAASTRPPAENSKALVSRRLAGVFGLDGLDDQKSRRVNIATLHRPRQERGQLRVIRGTSA